MLSKNSVLTGVDLILGATTQSDVGTFSINVVITLSNHPAVKLSKTINVIIKNSISNSFCTNDPSFSNLLNTGV